MKKNPLEEHARRVTKAHTALKDVGANSTNHRTSIFDGDEKFAIFDRPVNEPLAREYPENAST